MRTTTSGAGENVGQYYTLCIDLDGYQTISSVATTLLSVYVSPVQAVSTTTVWYLACLMSGSGGCWAEKWHTPTCAMQKAGWRPSKSCMRDATLQKALFLLGKRPAK